MSKIKSTRASELISYGALSQEYARTKCGYALVTTTTARDAVIIAEQEAEERHANQLQELKNIIVDVRIETCSHRNGKICFVDMERCRGVECLKIKAFSNKLSQKLTEKQ